MAAPKPQWDFTQFHTQGKSKGMGKDKGIGWKYNV